MSAKRKPAHLNRWGVYICEACSNNQHVGNGVHPSCQCTCTGLYDSKGRYVGRGGSDVG